MENQDKRRKDSMNGLCISSPDYNPIIVNDEPVQLDKGARYLGVQLDSKLN